MGNVTARKKDAALDASSRVDLVCHRFTHEELQVLYHDFLKVSSPISDRKAPLPDLEVEDVNQAKGLSMVKHQRDNFLDQPRFCDLIERLSIPHEISVAMFHIFDQNQDGTVDFAEFCAGMSVLCKGKAEEKIAFAFKVFDMDGDGFISKDELLHGVKRIMECAERMVVAEHLSMDDLNFVTQVNDEELIFTTLVQAFHDKDTNKDQRLSLEEFIGFARENKEVLQFLDQFDGLYTSKRKR